MHPFRNINGLFWGTHLRSPENQRDHGGEPQLLTGYFRKQELSEFPLEILFWAPLVCEQIGESRVVGCTTSWSACTHYGELVTHIHTCVHMCMGAIRMQKARLRACFVDLPVLWICRPGLIGPRLHAPTSAIWRVPFCGVLDIMAAVGWLECFETCVIMLAKGLKGPKLDAVQTKGSLLWVPGTLHQLSGWSGCKWTVWTSKN